LTESQHHSKFSYEQLSDFILIALRLPSLNSVVYNRMYLAHIAADIHIYMHVYTVKLSLSTPWRSKWSGGIPPLILTWALDGDEWLAYRTWHFTAGIEPRITLNKWLGVTTGRFEGFGWT